MYGQLQVMSIKSLCLMGTQLNIHIFCWTNLNKIVESLLLSREQNLFTQGILLP